MENPIEMDNPHDLLGESIFVRENRMSSSLFFSLPRPESTTRAGRRWTLAARRRRGRCQQSRSLTEGVETSAEKHVVLGFFPRKYGSLMDFDQ
jgi:hypothetical protein